MSWSDNSFTGGQLKRCLVFLALLALPACGFNPAYAPGGAGAGLRDQVSFQAPTTREEFTLVARLEDRLGRANAGDYALAYTLTTSSSDLAITADQEIQRYNLTGTLSYSLSSGGAVVSAGAVSSFSAYSATGTTVATRAAERDAYNRLMVVLADQLVTRLITITPPGQS